MKHLQQAFLLLLLITLTPITTTCSFGLDVTIEYDWDTGTFSKPTCDIMPQGDDSFSSTDLLCYPSANITKVIVSHIILVTQKDPEKTALLKKQLKQNSIRNKILDEYIAAQQEKKQNFDDARYQADMLAKNKLNEMLHAQST